MTRLHFSLFTTEMPNINNLIFLMHAITYISITWFVEKAISDLEFKSIFLWVNIKENFLLSKTIPIPGELNLEMQVLQVCITPQ